MTLLEKMDRMPPCIARIMARTGGRSGRLLTNHELCEMTGFSLTKVLRISRMKSWRNVKVGDAEKFIAACSESWPSVTGLRWYLKNRLMTDGLDGLKRMDHLNPRDKAPYMASQIAYHTRMIQRIFSDGNDSSGNSNK